MRISSVRSKAATAFPFVIGSDHRVGSIARGTETIALGQQWSTRSSRVSTQHDAAMQSLLLEQ